MKNCFIAVRRKRESDGSLAKVSDETTDLSAFYLEHHTHPALKGKEFVNTHEAIQAMIDHQLKGQDTEILKRAGALIEQGETQAALALIAQAGSTAPKIGEVIFLNVIEF